MKSIVSFLLLKRKPGVEVAKLQRAAVTSPDNNLCVSTRTISRIWKRAKTAHEDPSIMAFVASPMKKGGTPRWSRDEIKEAAKEVPLCLRRTIRSLSSAVAVPTKSTLHQLKQDKSDAVIVSHSNALKPLLLEQYELARCLYALDHLDIEEDLFHSYENEISEIDLHLYIVPVKETQICTCQHKSHILKLMFLCAIAKPIYNDNGGCLFDGKIGMWPFIRKNVATRNSVRRPAGTIKIECLSVTKFLYREFLVTHVIPAIKEKWPYRQQGRSPRIQQDGAPAHIKNTDPEFVAVAVQGAWNISLYTQPSQSPDSNLCDLSFFVSLQLNQWNHGLAQKTQELIDQVMVAFNEYNPRKLQFGFLTLQTCLDEILLDYRGNDYKIPHMEEIQLLQEDRLLSRIPASDGALSAAKTLLGLE